MASNKPMFPEQDQRIIPTLAEPPPATKTGVISKPKTAQKPSESEEKSMERMMNNKNELDQREGEGGQPRMAYSLNQSKSLSCVPEYLGKIPRSQIKRKYLINKTFVKLALRHKLAGTLAKLHKKYLKAGLKAKLTLVNNLFSLYQYLIPYTSKKKIFPVYVDLPIKHDVYLGGQPNAPAKIRAKLVQIIDHSLVDVLRYLNKVLAAALGLLVPTFNLLDTAVHLLFGINEYTLIRVTRLALDDTDGLIVLKLELAKPGDTLLIDSPEFSDEMMHLIGKPGETPLNLFIKKVVARPRYKLDMKVFLVLKNLHCSLYLDERMLERDLINGIVNLNLDGSKPSIIGSGSTKGELMDFANPHVADAVDFNNNLILDFSHYGNSSDAQVNESKLILYRPPDARAVYVTFPFDNCIKEFEKLLKLLKSEPHLDSDMTLMKDSLLSSLPKTDSLLLLIPLRTELLNLNLTLVNSLTEISLGDQLEKLLSAKVKLETETSANNSSSSSASGLASGLVPPQSIQMPSNSKSLLYLLQGLALDGVRQELSPGVVNNEYNRPSLRRYLRFNKLNEQIHLPLPNLSADFLNSQANGQRRSSKNSPQQQDHKSNSGSLETLPSLYMLQPHWPNNLPTMMPHDIVSQWNNNRDESADESEGNTEGN